MRRASRVPLDSDSPPPAGSEPRLGAATEADGRRCSSGYAMPVNLSPPSRLDPVPGIAVGATSLRVREQPRDDLAVFRIAPGGTAAAVFTRNAFCAAPVHVAREHLERTSPRFLVINAGNANAGTGHLGIEASRRVCEGVARAGGCEVVEVLPFSTGVVGELLDTAPFETAVPRVVESVSEDGWLAAARAIMTTDTVAKGISRRFVAGGREHTVTGIVKGSGMICPDMATMLAFVATDASVPANLLDRVLTRAVDRSFNCITVDGDTSTNDACVLMASGAGARIEEPDGADAEALSGAVVEVCTALAQSIVRDGEGATKFITIDVSGGVDRAECRKVAFTVAHSPLVKTAMFASDANWGRILAAVGRAGVPDLDVDRIRIRLGDVPIVENGARAVDYREQLGASVMAREEIDVRIELGRGKAHARVWTCDLSHGYVTINAEYRS